MLVTLTGVVSVYHWPPAIGICTLTQQMSPPGPYLMISGLKFFLDVGRITVKIDGLTAFFWPLPFLFELRPQGQTQSFFIVFPEDIKHF